MIEGRYTVVATRGTVTSIVADSVERALAWAIARTFRDQGLMAWIVSADFTSIVIHPDQSLDEEHQALAAVS